VDWNNDGKKDLIVGESCGEIRIYQNVGTDRWRSRERTHRRPLQRTL